VRATIPVVADPWEDGDKHIDLEEIRAHLRRLSDADLLRYGRAARHMTSPDATWVKRRDWYFAFSSKKAALSGADDSVNATDQLRCPLSPINRQPARILLGAKPVTFSAMTFRSCGFRGRRFTGGILKPHSATRSHPSNLRVARYPPEAARLAVTSRLNWPVSASHRTNWRISLTTAGSARMSPCSCEPTFQCGGTLYFLSPEHRINPKLN